MGNKVSDQGYVSTSQYDSYLSPTANKSNINQSSVEHKGRLWALGQQIITKLSRIGHALSSLFKNHSAEWINNKFVFNKLEKNIQIVMNDVDAMLHDPKKLTHDNIIKNKQRINEMCDTCLKLTGTVSDTDEVNNLSKLINDYNKINKMFVDADLELTKTLKSSKTMKSTEAPDSIGRKNAQAKPKESKWAEAPAKTKGATANTAVAQKHEIGKLMRGLIHELNTDPFFKESLGKKWAKIPFFGVEWSGDNKALQKANNTTTYPALTKAEVREQIDKVFDLVVKGYKQLGKTHPHVVEEYIKEIELAYSKLDKLEKS